MDPAPGSAEDSQESWQEILAEHDEIRQTLAAIESAGDPGELEAHLARLRRSLPPHFAREEISRALRELFLAQAPHQLARFEAVLGEHAAILATLGDLAATAAAAVRRGQASVPEALRRELAAWVGRLRAHEECETQLILDTVHADLGAGD
jgi:hypothetical protein